jgi:hypothetical protein
MPTFHRTANALIPHIRILGPRRIQLLGIEEQSEWSYIDEMVCEIDEPEAPRECWGTVPSILRMLRDHAHEHAVDPGASIIGFITHGDSGLASDVEALIRKKIETAIAKFNMFSATDRNHEIWRNDRPEAAGQNC